MKGSGMLRDVRVRVCVIMYVCAAAHRAPSPSPGLLPQPISPSTSGRGQTEAPALHVVYTAAIDRDYQLETLHYGT